MGYDYTYDGLGIGQGIALPSGPSFILGKLELVTPPSGQVLTVQEAKSHCRVDLSNDDGLISNLIDRATEWVEKNVQGHRQLLTATYDVPLADWWSWNTPQRIPRPPLQSIGSVQYYDLNGNLTTLAASNYLVRTPWRGPGTIDWAPFVLRPVYQADRRQPIVIRFTCGYGAAANVPGTLKQAILLLVGHWYVNREAVGVVGDVIALAVDSLLQSEAWGSYA